MHNMQIPVVSKFTKAINAEDRRFRHKGRLVKFCQVIYNLITCAMILLLFCLCVYVYF